MIIMTSLARSQNARKTEEKTAPILELIWNSTMADSAANRKRSFNPLALHLQKLALELKCPLWFVVVTVLG